MLFSMILSYRLAAGRYSPKVYAMLMAFWIILASLLTIFLASAWILALFLLPLMLFSFPFLSTVEQLHSYTPVRAYNIQFFSMNIVSISPENALVYGFSFFVLVNLAGAVLGYKIDKMLQGKKVKRNLFDFFQSSTLVFFGTFYLVMAFFYFALGIITPGYYLNENTQIWFTIADALFLFSRFLFWVPAVIATTIYGIYMKRLSKHSE